MSYSTVFAQLTNAILAIESGEIKIAKENIDKQMLKEKSLSDAKSWYYKGVVYESIAFTKDEAIQNLEPTNATKICMEAYQKVVALDKPKGEWATQAAPRLENIWGFTFNQAI